MKKIIRRGFIIALIFSQSLISFAQQKTGANTETSVSSSNDTLAVWAAPAEQKVKPSDKVELANVVWSKSNRKVNVAGAG
ncbi:MAG TPA: hypothetical protein VNS32_21825, partial [Flavisolibacter sp.]|nr:hypothetical protein [Flavisolibacter sp.]